MMIFRGDRTTKEKGEILSLWELAAYDFFMNEYKNDLIETLVNFLCLTLKTFLGNWDGNSRSRND